MPGSTLVIPKPDRRSRASAPHADPHGTPRARSERRRADRLQSDRAGADRRSSDRPRAAVERVPADAWRDEVAAVEPHGPAPGPHAPAGESTGDASDVVLGRGRSGVVFLSRDDAGRPVARKVFTCDRLTKLVHYVLSGAPNPYMWSEPAVRTAVLRRRVTAALVSYWFGDKLRVAQVRDHRFSAALGAFEMRCEFIAGRHVALHSPYTPPDDDTLHDVTHNVMKPLQAHLAASGLDGLVWQAGRGNPVALNNFMSDGPSQHGGQRWAWIDLESGVPALAPWNPVDLVSFYIPKSLHHGRPLFDDVDVHKLRAYVARHRQAIAARLGRAGRARLVNDINALAKHQRVWTSQPRHLRGIAYRHATGSITRKHAEWYADHPACWTARELAHGLWSAIALLVVSTLACWRALRRVNVGKAVATLWRAARSESYRERLARDYVTRRVDDWRDRRQLDHHQARDLQSHLRAEESCAYLGDFGVHIAVKPFVKLAEWWVVPGLWIAGVVDHAFLATFMVAAGPVVRTLYTTYRLIRNTLSGRERPWVALGVGVIPVLGNLAFPIQLLATGVHTQATLARFIVYDTFSRIGRCVPIWGGRDTLTEHMLNRCPDILLRRRTERAAAPNGCYG
ncbi:MAG: hypothetical protein ACE5E6_06365 [Phycisphaerae bacterium]